MKSEADTDRYAAANVANASFWNEMCGTQLARSLGVTDHSVESLRKFDDWYFDFYPYLSTHIPFGDMQGRNVLEVGLGYGSVSQRIAEHGAVYQGLDVAAGPVGLVNHRLQMNGFGGSAVQGSVLAAPFPDHQFDFVVSIGCFHHTGDVQRAVDESFRMLKPGGCLVFMVYYAYSYRRWLRSPLATLSAFGRERFAWHWKPQQEVDERGAYDINGAGEAAPITEFLSAGQLDRICRRFSKVEMTRENAASESIFRWFARDALIRSAVARHAGLDIYVKAWK